MCGSVAYRLPLSKTLKKLAESLKKQGQIGWLSIPSREVRDFGKDNKLALI